MLLLTPPDPLVRFVQNVHQGLRTASLWVGRQWLLTNYDHRVGEAHRYIEETGWLSKFDGGGGGTQMGARI